MRNFSFRTWSSIRRTVSAAGFAGDGPPELRKADGLEQIIHGIHLEGLHGVLIVRGGHNDGAGELYLREDLKAPAVAKLHIHKDDIRSIIRGKPLDRFLYRTDGAHNLYLGEILFQQGDHMLAGPQFVFYDECFHSWLFLRCKGTKKSSDSGIMGMVTEKL